MIIIFRDAFFVKVKIEFQEFIQIFGFGFSYHTVSLTITALIA